jgi:transposase
LKFDTPSCEKIGGFEAPMITNEVYMEIEVLRKHGFSLRRIAAEVGCAVNTVRSHLAAGTAPKYERSKQRVHKLSAFETYLRERQAAAYPLWIPASVLHREIVEQGYQGGLSQLRSFLRSIKPPVPTEPLVRFETPPGEQMQVDWVEFRKGTSPLYAFCATLGYSRASYVHFVADMKVDTLIECHQHAFVALGGVPKRILYDNMKTIVLARDVAGPGEHRYHAGFLDYAKHCGFVIKLCRPYRARTKGKVERFNGYLRRSFYVPLATQLKQAGLQLDLATANSQVRQWLSQVAHQRTHGTTQDKPGTRLQQEQGHLQPIPAPWRGDIAAARPQGPAKACELTTTPVPDTAISTRPSTRPPVVTERIEAAIPLQHPLQVYQQLLAQCQAGVQVAP